MKKISSKKVMGLEQEIYSRYSWSTLSGKNRVKYRSPETGRYVGRPEIVRHAAGANFVVRGHTYAVQAERLSRAGEKEPEIKKALQDEIKRRIVKIVKEKSKSEKGWSFEVIEDAGMVSIRYGESAQEVLRPTSSEVERADRGEIEVDETEGEISPKHAATVGEETERKMKKYEQRLDKFPLVASPPTIEQMRYLTDLLSQRHATPNYNFVRTLDRLQVGLLIGQILDQGY